MARAGAGVVFVEKTLDTLNFYFRTLVVISATVLVLAIGQIVAKSNQTNNQIQIAKAADTAYRQLSGDIQARATATYRKMFLDALAHASPSVKAVIGQTQFSPVAVEVRQRSAGAQSQPVVLPLRTNAQAAALSQMSQLFGWPDAVGGYPNVVFDPEVARDLTEGIEASDEFRPLLHGGDLMVVIAPPRDRSKTCQLYFESAKWDATRQPRMWPDVPCEIQGNPVDVTENVAAFAASAPFAPAFDPGMLVLTPEAAAAVLTEQAKATPDKPEPVDLGGPKVDPKLALQIAPLLLVILLLLMVGPMRTAARLSEHEPIEGGFWFGQFLGLPALVIFAPLVVLPAAAAFCSAGIGDLFGHPLIEARAAAAVVATLAVGIFILNVCDARAWKVRVENAGPVNTNDRAALASMSAA
jgi:hypothetical protein